MRVGKLICGILIENYSNFSDGTEEGKLYNLKILNLDCLARFYK